MLLSSLVGAVAACAIMPAVVYCINMRRYRPPPEALNGEIASVSVLIPARNEEDNIGPALAHVLRSRDVAIEVLVLDDNSSDGTAEVVRGIAARDSRVRLLPGVALPPGWNGKQFACWTLAQEAYYPLLAFLDADVRVEPDLLARMAAFKAKTGTGLVSGFPRLITVTWLEKLLLPLIHFVLLAFLPMRAMRRSTRTSVAAGCGQFLLVGRDAYFIAGGHSAIQETMHDGLMLPRALRRAGFRTDIADITELASVRMYDSAAKVWMGLAKNATEGIATPGKILPLSLHLFLGQVMPTLLCLLLVVAGVFFLLVGGTLGMDIHIAEPRKAALLLALTLSSLVASYLPRMLAVVRFRQPWSSAFLHPFGILLLLSVQWYALVRKLAGKPVGWRQRTYSSGTGAELSS